MVRMPPWPPGFTRVPDADWTSIPIDDLATHYDTVETHGWYDNLDPTVDDLASAIRPGERYVDYSGGTGILIGRLLAALPDADIGLINVDSSPKFLRLSLEKFRDEPRVAFRLIRYLDERKRLQYVDEVLPGLVGATDGLVSTNAVHLYQDLDATLAAWARLLRPDGRVFVQSGNIGSSRQTEGTWIIDETVHALAAAAEDIARRDDRFAAYADILDVPERMARYHDLRRRYFLPVREVAHYVAALEGAGFAIESIVRRPITARKDEWLRFLQVYHEGILGWVGGTRKVDGHDPSPEAVTDRLHLMRRAADHVFPAPTFRAEWTYVTGVRT